MLKQRYIQILKSETVHIGIIYLLSFLLPFVISKPQIILGILINFLLIYSISKYSLKKIFPILILPSISSFLNNMLFGTSTIFLLYLIPFISISNFLFVYLFKKISIEYVNIIIGACAKAFILYFITLILIKITNMPDAFLGAMSGIQLITALTGGFAAILILKDTSSS